MHECYDCFWYVSACNVKIQLVERIFLILLARNLLNIALFNSSTGVAKDIFCNDIIAPKPPKYVWVDFGNDFMGPAFFSKLPKQKMLVSYTPSNK